MFRQDNSQNSLAVEKLIIIGGVLHLLIFKSLATDPVTDANSGQGKVRKRSPATNFSRKRKHAAEAPKEYSKLPKPASITSDTKAFPKACPNGSNQTTIQLRLCKTQDEIRPLSPFLHQPLL